MSTTVTTEANTLAIEHAPLGAEGEVHEPPQGQVPGDHRHRRPERGEELHHRENRGSLLPPQGNRHGHAMSDQSQVFLRHTCLIIKD